MIAPLPHEYEEATRIVDRLFGDVSLTQEKDDAQFCRGLVKRFGDAGILQFVAPSPSVRMLCALRYAIAQHTALGDLLFAMQGLGSYPISLAGSDEQKSKYLAGVTSGNLIAAFAITEPEAGSDAGALTLRAQKHGDDYVLDGQKTLISNAGLADFYTLFARTGEGNRGITAFIVDASSSGLSIHSQELLAVHPIGELNLRDCVIPHFCRLGNEGEGLKIAYSTLDVFRSTVGAAAIGMAQRAFHEAVIHSKQRTQFGKTLAEFQAIQFKLAEMAQLLQASRLLIWDAASKKDAGATRITLESAMAKSFATEAAQQIIDQSLQIHGGKGLIRGTITERLYRDIRALRIYEGATEIQKLIIAQQILGSS